jgi:membrane protein implicated in regulation of membrane protease activity
LVSRTTSYLAVTLALVATYAVLVTAMSWLLPGSAAVVALATLVVAAAFRPLLKRVQQQVDRRFNRERVDGDRSVEEFGIRLRDQTDTDDVVVDLVGVVSRTLQPTTIVMWRSPAGSG